MSFSRKTVLLDCGASRTALGVFSQHRGRLRLDRHLVEVFPSPAGPADEWLDRTKAAFHQLRERLGRGGPCVLVLPGHAVLTKFIKVPRVKPEQREKVIHFESSQKLPVPLSELAWDSVVSGEQESGLEVMLAAAHLQRVEPLCAAARAAGFEPRLALPASLALLAAFRLVHGHPASPVVVINVGARSTTLLFLETGRFVARTFALGATRMPASEATHAAGRLALELTRSVLFFRQQGGLADPTQVFLTGGGAQLPALGEVLACRLKLPVAPLDLSGSLEIGRDVSGTEQNSPSPELLGAAATQLREGHSILNLLPPADRLLAGRRHRQTLVVAASLFVALSLSTLWHFRRQTQTTKPHEIGLVHHDAAPMVDQPRPVEDAGDSPAAAVAEAAVRELPFGVELLGVKREPYRLQLAGYAGEPGDFLAVFVSPGQDETLVARTGHRFEPLGIVLRKFEVGKVPVAHEDAWPVGEVAAIATLYDERADEEVVLDSRHAKLLPPHAQLRVSTAGGESLTAHEGQEFSDGPATYRIDRIRADPPEVVIARLTPAPAEPDLRLLHPVATRADLAAAPLKPALPRGGLVATGR